MKGMQMKWRSGREIYFVVLDVINDTKFERENEKLYLTKRINFYKMCFGRWNRKKSYWCNKTNIKISVGAQPETIFD